MDSCFSTHNSVGFGVGEQYHDGRFHSHPSGYCNYHPDYGLHPGAAIMVRCPWPRFKHISPGDNG